MNKRVLAFVTVLAAVITVYFVIVATVLGDAAATSADRAVVTLVKVLIGAAALVTLGLLAALARLDDATARRHEQMGPGQR